LLSLSTPVHSSNALKRILGGELQSCQGSAITQTGRPEDFSALMTATIGKSITKIDKMKVIDTSQTNIPE
jgi:hypothetical protein